MTDYKNVKLIVTDMDGTLLHSDYSLNQEFFDLYEQLKELNIKFLVASGRQYNSLSTIFEPIKEEIYFISENGNNVVYREESIFVQSLDLEVIKETVEICRNINGSGVLVCGLKSAYIEDASPSFLQQAIQYYPEYKKLSNLLDPVDDILIKVAVYNPGGAKKEIYPLLEHLTDKYRVVISEECWLDISKKDSDKGSALHKVQNRLNISKEETMVFGDYLNDLEMMKCGYYSYSMENAHPAIKEVARFRTDSNDNDGVLKILREVIKQNRDTKR